MYILVKILLLIFSLIGLMFNILAIIMSEIVVLSGFDKFAICSQILFSVVTILAIIIKKRIQVKALSIVATVNFLVFCSMGFVDLLDTQQRANLLIYKFFTFVYLAGILLSFFNIILEIKSITKGNKSGIWVN